MQYEKLKKQVMIEASITMVVLLALGAIVYLIGSIADDYQTSNDALQKQVDAVDLEMNTLKGRFSNIKKNLDIYEEVKKKQADGRLAINRQQMLEKFNQFKTQYVLGGLRLSVSVPQEVKDAIFKRKNSSVNFSEVSASFDVTSDATAYELVDSLRDELPGICKLTRFNITLNRPFDEEVVQVISQKGSYPLVRTEMNFIWFGINATNPDPKPEGAANAPK